MRSISKCLLPLRLLLLLSAKVNSRADEVTGGRLIRDDWDPCEAAGCSFGCLEEDGSCDSHEGEVPASVWDDAADARGALKSWCETRVPCSTGGRLIRDDGDVDGGGSCDHATSCWEGSFCHVRNGVGGDGTTCSECPWHSYFCFDGNLTAAGVESCFQSCQCLDYEHADAFLGVDVDGEEVDIESLHFGGGFVGNASGPLVDVGLGTEEASAYAGENDVAGSVCLIERGEISFYDKIANCQANGGIGAVIFNNEPGDGFSGVTDEDEDTAIPSVAIGMEDGEALRSNAIGLTATLRLVPFTMSCQTECSVHNDCPDKHFCNFDYETHGYCESCTGFDENCYFSGLPLEGAQHCAEICGSSLTFDDCKLCKQAVTGDALGTATSESDTCEFCPSPYLDQSYHDVVVPMFGDGITCFLLDEFFTNYEISTQDKNCQISLMYNFLCGCEGGTGYAGANTPAKRKAFVWLPRSTSIISFIVRTAILNSYVVFF